MTQPSPDVSDQQATTDTNSPNQPLLQTRGVSWESGEDLPRYAPGDAVGKYQILDFLGRGGMGEVYRASDSFVEREVALKVMPAHLTGRKLSLQRFMAEARAVGKLMNPHTVTLFEIGEHDGGYFLAMEFVGGGSLAALLAGRRPLPWSRATRFAWEVSKGLIAAHAVGLIHRDIKPENLLRTWDDHVKITDFGLAKALHPLSDSSLGITRPGDLLGTPYYMSPEQFMSGPADARSDIYSMGATYYQMLTGEPPYRQATNLIALAQAHCQGPLCDPRDVVPETPKACAEIVLRAMAKNPEERFQSARELAASLKTLLSTAAPSIWLIEPSALQSRSVERTLKELGVSDVRIMPTIGATLTALQTEIPHALLSAMHFDDGTGDDLIDQIHNLPGTAGIRCFLISSAVAAGAASQSPGRPVVLPKPVTRDMLIHVLNQISTH